MLRLSNFIIFFLLLSISSSYLIGVFGSSMGIIDDIATMAVILLPLPAVVLFRSHFRKLNNPLLVITALFYITITFLLLYSSLIPHVYELYKLFTFMAFIPLFMILRPFSVNEIEHKFLFLASVFLFINTLVILLQYTVSPYIVQSLGMNIGMNNIGFAAGRYAGLFSNANNLGDLALLVFLLNEIVHPSRYKIIRMIAIAAVLISSSKHAIVILFAVIVYQNRGMVLQNFQKFMLGFLFIVIAGFLSYSVNQSAFDSKFSQYTRIFTAEDTGRIQMGTIESRAQKSIAGMKLVDQYFPLGTGLGTWGDASSNFNTNNHLKYPEKMSDSAFMHILVEQGIFIFMYLLVMLLGYFSVIRFQRKYFISLIIIFALASFPTMGMSSGGWPLVFAYIYARLIFSKSLYGTKF